MTGVWAELKSHPASWATVALCSSLYLYCFNARVDVRRVAFQYDHVVREHEWWRLLTATVSHVGLMHVAMNMYTVVAFAELESVLGTAEYLKLCFILAAVCGIIEIVVSRVMAERFRIERYRTTYSLGYSGVVFGLMTVAARELDMRFFGLPAALSPFLMLVITQIVVPNASFLGHLAGIVGGLIYTVGAFRWFGEYLFLCALFWSLALALYSARLTTNLPLGFIKIEMTDGVEEGGRESSGSGAAARAPRRSTGGSGRLGGGASLSSSNAAGPSASSSSSSLSSASSSDDVVAPADVELGRS